MRHNLAKEKLAAGKPINVVAPGYSSAGLVEMLGRMGFDAVFIDCEHGPVGWEDVEHMVRAAELVDVTPIIRVQSNDHSTITRTGREPTEANGTFAWNVCSPGVPLMTPSKVVSDVGAQS